VSDGLVPFRLAEALFTPPCKPSPEKRVMTPEQVRVALAALAIRERLIFRLAVFEEMRPGEIHALCIGKIRSESLLIDQRIYGSTIDSPKGRQA